MQNVSLDPTSVDADYIELDVDNTVNVRSPVIRVIESNFPGVSGNGAADGISQNERTFRLNVQNRQYKKEGSSNGCYLDYKGTIFLKRNVFGVLPEYSISVSKQDCLPNFQSSLH
jgi:hypothetical protein